MKATNATKTRMRNDKHLFAVISAMILLVAYLLDSVLSSHLQKHSPHFLIDKWRIATEKKQATICPSFICRWVSYCIVRLKQWWHGFVAVALYVLYNSAMVFFQTLDYLNYKRNARIDIFSFLLTLFPWKTKCSCTPLNATFYKKGLHSYCCHCCIDLFTHTHIRHTHTWKKRTFHDISHRDILNVFIESCRKLISNYFFLHNPATKDQEEIK